MYEDDSIVGSEFLKTFLCRQKCIDTSNAELEQGVIMTVSKDEKENGILHSQH